MFGRVLGCYTMYTFSAVLASGGILQRTKFTLCSSLAFSYIGIVTARHSSSGVSQTLRRCITNGITELSQRRHVYSAGRPSRWASAHILIHFYFISTIGANAVLSSGSSVGSHLSTSRSDPSRQRGSAALPRSRST